MTLNLVKPADPAALRALTEPAFLAKYEEYAASPEELYALDVDGVPVGWMHLHIPPEAKYSAFLYLYVAPDHRRHGIGTEAYRKAVRRIRMVGCDWWSSYPPSGTADAFCRAVGFTYTNTNHYLVWHGTAEQIDYPSDGIRPVEARDIPEGPAIWSREYARMHRGLGIPYDETVVTDEQIEADRREIAEHPERWANVRILEHEGRPAAYGALFADGSGVGGVAVDFACRGRGFGTRMTAYLTRESIRRGCPHPCLYCEAGNDDALHVYEKLGYRIESSETIAVKTRTSIREETGA